MLTALSVEDRAEVRERIALALSIPPLRALGVDQLSEPMWLLAEVLAERVGRAPDDFAVRILVGAVLGVGMAVMFAVAEDPEADIALLLDKALAQLEVGVTAGWT